MKALGYNVWAFRYTVLVISGAFCGLAGLLFAYNGSFVYPNHLGFDYSWIPMLVVILGGAGTKLGPIVGAGDRGVVRVLHQSAYPATLAPHPGGAVHRGHHVLPGRRRRLRDAVLRRRQGKA